MTATKPTKTSTKQAPARNSKGQLLPGHTANPHGRPSKGYSITDTIKAMMDEQPEIKRALGNKILEAALKGDLAAIKLLWQYMDGMPKQEIDQTVHNSTELSLLQHLVHDTPPLEPLPTEPPTSPAESEPAKDL